MVTYHTNLGIFQSPKRLHIHGTVFLKAGTQQPYYVVGETFDENSYTGTLVLEKAEYLGYVILTPVE